MKIYSKSDIGLVRKSNQDYFDTGWFSKEGLFAIVCDGMGGANGGSTASHEAVDFIASSLKGVSPEILSADEIRELMLKTTQDVNKKIYEMANQDSSLSGMGTTIVFLIISNNIAHFVHAGDSRAYVVSNDVITQVTKDHSIVQELLESGKITKEQAQCHPEKNIITRALGVYESIDLDYFQCELSENDSILICTDGLTNYLNDNELLNVINEFGYEGAVDEYISKSRACGGNDNITAVLIRK